MTRPRNMFSSVSKIAALLGAQSTTYSKSLDSRPLHKKIFGEYKTCDGHVKHYIGYVEIFSRNLVCNPKILMVHALLEEI